MATKQKTLTQHPGLLEELRRTSAEAELNYLLTLFSDLEKSMRAAAKLGQRRLFIASEGGGEFFAPFASEGAKKWLHETYGLDVIVVGYDHYISWEE